MYPNVLLASALLAFGLADDPPGEAPPPPPVVPPQTGPYTPALPNGPQPPPPVVTPPSGLSPTALADLLARLTGLVERIALPVAPSPQGAAQTAYATVPAPIVLAAPAATAPVQVLVPAGPVSRSLAAFGSRLTTLGQPRVRTLQLAPAYVAPYVAPVAPVAQAQATLPPLPSKQR